MSTFTYGYSGSGTGAEPPSNTGMQTFPGNSGCVLNLTTAISGGTQSQGVLLQYRGTKSKKRFRDASAVVFMGRDKPATETGQYNFRGMDVEYSFPDSNNVNLDGGSPLTGAQVEARIDAILDGLQTGGYVEYQDSRGRHIIGTFTSDPVIVDETVGWRRVSFSIVEVGTG